MLFLLLLGLLVGLLWLLIRTRGGGLGARSLRGPRAGAAALLLVLESAQLVGVVLLQVVLYRRVVRGYELRIVPIHGAELLAHSNNNNQHLVASHSQRSRDTDILVPGAIGSSCSSSCSYSASAS